MSVQEVVSSCVVHALSALRGLDPMPLKQATDFSAAALRLEPPEHIHKLVVAVLQLADPNTPLLRALAERLHAWDHSSKADWAPSTEPHSPERRRATLAVLGFDPVQQQTIDIAIPRFTEAERAIVIAEDHEPWYFGRKHTIRPFYWAHYAAQLQRTWDPRSVAILEESIEDVIARLSDPTRESIHPVKGLVMGYVQSGKTSHFMGLIAKAVDAGYRFIIVLAGTLDILRRQTQRRLDKELVGRELLETDEYGSDAEWGAFVSHGGQPSALGSVDWDRLTNSADDYRALKQLLAALEFKPVDKSKRFNHADNLGSASIKLVVLKKTPQRLRKLAHDLARLSKLRSALEHVPTLVIDDESDQASVNTIDQRRAGNQGARTGTNREIGGLLRMLPRAQYVGYTATPFANVFIDPDDAQDLFPKDFIVSLPRPDGYMGVADFYDLEGNWDDSDYGSNRKAFIRPVVGLDADEQNLPAAIDAFVLAGALKLFREDASGGRATFRHHTMLVHNSARVQAHAEDRAAIEDIFLDGARYQRSAGMEGLEALFTTDFVPVAAARGAGLAFPARFNDLRPFVSRCLTKICHDKAIRIVNGDAGNRDDTPAFDEVPVWGIIVGGTKLSRGYTVEGLTVSYYRRPAGAGDTLMQMGRWFGFRQGYHDLVRVYLGSAEPRGKTTVDLYEAFGALCRDEEALRQDLLKYGRGDLRPRQVPPLVHQHMAGLPPTSRNKMFNAEIASADFDGDWTEKTLAPIGKEAKASNLKALKDLLTATSMEPGELTFQFVNPKGARRGFAGYLGTADGETIVTFLSDYKWADGRNPIHLERLFISRRVSEGRFAKWHVIVPLLAGAGRAEVGQGLPALSVMLRARVSETRFGVYSEPRHREAAAHLSGISTMAEPSEPLMAHRNTACPTLLLYLIGAKGGEETGYSVGFGIQYPGKKAPQSLVWTVRDQNREGAVVVGPRVD